MTVIIYIYFLINIFFAGVLFERSFKEPKDYILIPIHISLLMPFKLIDLIIEFTRDMFWKFMNFTLIKVYIFYKKGKYKNLNKDQFKRAQMFLLNAKYDFQRRVWQNIINQNI